MDPVVFAEAGSRKTDTESPLKDLFHKGVGKGKQKQART